MHKIHIALAATVGFNALGAWSNMTTYRNELLTAVLFFIGIVFLCYTVLAWYGGSATEIANKLSWPKWLRLPFRQFIPMKEAARLLYEHARIRNNLLAVASERLSGN